MAIFEVWDIVKVPFPHKDRPVRQRCPALVIAAGEIEAAHGLLWLVMITSAENRAGRVTSAYRISTPLVFPPIDRAPSEDRHRGCTRCATAWHTTRR